MRAHPDDKLLQTLVHRSAAGLSQFVRFYVGRQQKKQWTIDEGQPEGHYSVNYIIIYLKEFVASDWLTAMCEIVMSHG